MTELSNIDKVDNKTSGLTDDDICLLPTATEGQHLKRGASEWAASSEALNRLSEITKVVTFTSATDAPIGDDDSVDLGVNTGIISRVRVRAGSASKFKAGQQASGTALVNDGTGIAPADTAIVYDGQVPADAFAAGDYIRIGNEIMLVSDDDESSLTVIRARKDTIAEYIDDNATITKCNNGVRIAFYPNNSYNEEEKFFEWTDIMIAEFTTDAAITEDDEFLGLTTDPTLVTDLDIGDLILIDDTADEVAMVQSVFGDMISATYDNVIFVQAPLAAHTITKQVERLLQYDIPIPFSMDSGTTMYIRINIDEKIAEDITIMITLLVDA